MLFIVLLFNRQTQDLNYNLLKCKATESTEHTSLTLLPLLFYPPNKAPYRMLHRHSNMLQSLVQCDPFTLWRERILLQDPGEIYNGVGKDIIMTFPSN